MSSTNASASDTTRTFVSGQLNVRERSQKCFCAVCTFLRELTRLSNRVYTPCRGDKLAKQNDADVHLAALAALTVCFQPSAHCTDGVHEVCTHQPGLCNAWVTQILIEN